MSTIRHTGIRVVTLVLGLLIGMNSMTSTATEANKRIINGLVRIKVTSQRYDFFRPWKKKSPESREGIGTVISRNRILATAALIENSNYIELNRIGDGEKCPAVVEQVDYSANLAVLVPTDPEFLRQTRPLSVFSRKIKVGDSFLAWQFEANGTPLIADAELKEIEVKPYPYDFVPHLVFRVKTVLSQVSGSYTLPVTKGNKLIGLMMGHNQGGQTMTLIPPPIITHFLNDLDDGDYDGFPLAGFSFSPLENKQLRRFLEVHDEDGGIFIDKVRPGGPADNAGLRAGDVLLAIDQHNIDKSGQYIDRDYGKLLIAHLITTRSYEGDFRRFRIFRDKKETVFDVHLNSLNSEDYPIPPFVIDQAPEYMIVGGLVLRELSVQFLKEWGANWRTTAPRNFQFYAHHQWDLYSPERKIVILSEVLASEGNIGYQGLHSLVVTDINGKKITRLRDIPTALGHPMDGFHKIEFADDPKTIYLDSSSLERENRIIQKRFELPALARFNQPE